MPGNCEEYLMWLFSLLVWFQPKRQNRYWHHTFLTIVDKLTLFFTLQLHVLALVHRACGLVRFRHRKHSVSFRKDHVLSLNTCFGHQKHKWKLSWDQPRCTFSKNVNMVRGLWCIPMWTYQWFASIVFWQLGWTVKIQTVFKLLWQRKARDHLRGLNKHLLAQRSDLND